MPKGNSELFTFKYLVQYSSAVVSQTIDIILILVSLMNLFIERTLKILLFLSDWRICYV